MNPPKNLNSAVRGNTLWWIEKIQSTDILVGIPSYNNEATISYVVSTVAEGLHKHFAGAKSAILISDGGSLDDTREEAYNAKIPKGVERRVSIYRGLSGKGTSLRAIFEVAGLLKARACAVFDSDLKSITPRWVKCVVEPIWTGEAEYVTPFYRRHKFDGTITNQIVYPLTRALYGQRLRQPIGGDFGFSVHLASYFARQNVWLTDVAHFGIDIWMTTTAINEGLKILQVDLGVKRHNPKEPSTDLGPMFYQVLSTLFYLMGQYERKWRESPKSKPVRLSGSVEPAGNPEPVQVNLDKLKDEFVEGFGHFAPLYQQMLDSAVFAELTSVAASIKEEGISGFSAELWARVVYDFAYTYQSWSRNRRRLVDILVPLYFGRTAAFCEEVLEMNEAEAEAIVEAQAEAFESLKPYLIQKFKRWED